MGLKAGYRESEIGAIPSEWEAVPLGQMFTFRNGLNKAKKYFGQGTPIVNYMDVFGIPGLRTTDLKGCVAVSKQELKAYSVQKGDVFFTRTSETVEEIGVSSVMLDDPVDTVFSGFVLRGRPIDDSLDDDFKKYCFSSRNVRQQIISKSSYTTRALTNGRALAGVRIARPPLSEQRAIADALSNAEALIASLDALIAKKQALKQAAVRQLFSGKARLPGHGGEWGLARLKSLLQQPATYGIVKAGAFQRTGIRMLRGGDIRDGRIVGDPPFVTLSKSNEFARTVLHDGDVVIALVGYPGESARVPKWLIGANISRAVGLLRPTSKLLSDFLVCYLNSPDGRREFLKPSAGSAQLVVNLRDLNELQVPVLSLAEQAAIADMLADIDDNLTALESKRHKACALKQGMTQELLTGRIRLT